MATMEEKEMQEMVQEAKESDELQAMREQNNKILEEIKSERSVNKVIEKLNVLGETNQDKPMTQAYIAQMIVGLRWSLTLDFLHFSLEYADKEKILRIYKQNVKSEVKRMKKKFNTSKYGFVNLDMVIATLRKFYSEDDVELFIFSVCRCVNSRGVNFINDLSLTLTQMFKNILMLALDDYPEREEMLQGINRYLEAIKN